jgi:anaerobic magnesium-protoporphyrin IX monomethyl ester cyclase
MSKKVLLVRPPATTSLGFGSGFKKNLGGHEMELGLLYLASFLEGQGIESHFFDMSLYNDSDRRLLALLKESKFDFIGLTAYTSFINSAHSVAKFIRRYTETPIVIGGIHASALPKETLQVFDNFDFLIYGEGEEAFSELVLGKDITKIAGLVWRKNNHDIVVNLPREPVKDLDRLPFPARHLLDLEKYIPFPGNYYQLPTSGILSARGCPFQCTFCGRTGTRFKNMVRFRSVENLISEIEFCIEKFGIRDFRFYDDSFVLNKKRLIDFCEVLVRNKIKITWNCYSRVDLVEEDLLWLMKRAGCYHIKFGIEFGTQKWLDKTKKGITLEQARRAVRAVKKVGMAVKSSFIIGMPGETIDEIIQTIRFAKELNSTYSTFGIFTLLPGSELFDEAKAQGTLLSENFDYYFNRSENVLKNQLDISILRNFIKIANRQVYLNHKFLIYRILHLARNPTFSEVKTLFKGVLF